MYDFFDYLAAMYGDDFDLILAPGEYPSVRVHAFNDFLGDLAMDAMRADANGIKNVWFNDKKKVTVVEFNDGEKVKVTCHPADHFSHETGLALAYMKHSMGSSAAFNDALRKWCPEEEN